ncbi:Glu-tRNA(Gln) amidotransferase GatDE subunit E [Candidatus Woesearchaeota archaeon]|nr:MAG: Glu-tRNA(Gln) amidotransferase GatDE subunit E [Candidatus Woesearchaeota archaeon]
MTTNNQIANRKSINYEAVNFRCGIEIHQQLEGKKLFCPCPTIIRKDEPHFTIVRRLRASAGESGAVDAAASFEQAKQKTFLYQGYQDTTCLVELDEEPIHPINREVLITALQVAKLLSCTIIPSLQVMRKVVVDGSNVSGFQRTILVGVNGTLNVDGATITIPTVCLEEEACQVVERTKEQDTYNLSRLGIPLIEIATGPDITSPEQCQIVAAKLGMILRSTGACKRGIGSIRQDINVSTKNHPRVEIKGFQDLRSIPAILAFEIQRQQDAVAKKENLASHVRKAEPDMTTSYLRPMPGADRMYPETDHPPIEVNHDDVLIPRLLDDIAEELKTKYGIPPDLVKDIINKNLPFEEYVKTYNAVDPKLIAAIIVKNPKELRRKLGLEYNVHRHAPALLSRLQSRTITPSSVMEIQERQARGEAIHWSLYEPISEAAIEGTVKRVMQENPNAPIGALMGIIMKELRGKADGKTVMELLKKHKT